MLSQWNSSLLIYTEIRIIWIIRVNPREISRIVLVRTVRHYSWLQLETRLHVNFIDHFFFHTIFFKYDAHSRRLANVVSIYNRDKLQNYNKYSICLLWKSYKSFYFIIVLFSPILFMTLNNYIVTIKQRKNYNII